MEDHIGNSRCAKRQCSKPGSALKEREEYTKAKNGKNNGKSRVKLFHGENLLSLMVTVGNKESNSLLYTHMRQPQGLSHKLSKLRF